MITFVAPVIPSGVAGAFLRFPLTQLAHVCNSDPHEPTSANDHDGGGGPDARQVKGVRQATRILRCASDRRQDRQSDRRLPV
jgi:hypothetical protein